MAGMDAKSLSRRLFFEDPPLPDQHFVFRYFFGPITCLAFSAAFFLRLILSALTFFWLDRFCVDLGDLSPMIVCLNWNLSFRKVPTKVRDTQYKLDPSDEISNLVRQWAPGAWFKQQH